ncbi:serine hydrolase [Methylocystis sp. H4A]|uniref:serine hydrolase domain-containing protein n=1 Tax=Methylocystis sp. H4A TaxID=2785788 RepID=UPI0018C322FC|nr:serine hydrolase domain-containing protein [Methylocystis sp. H4A]MBG0803582.1 serine hydrolase [Methylocystis sp. H4A]
MSNQTEIGVIVRNHVAHLTGEPAPNKLQGVLVGVTYKGARYYYHFGQVKLYSGASDVLIKDIVFFIGSNSKVFTATLLALAATAAQNPVTPSTPAASLLPSSVGMNEPCGEILLWHLATHSAGYPDGPCGPPYPFGSYPFSSMGQFLNDFTPPYAPGKYWVYSNQSFALLGVLLSHAYSTDATSSGWDDSYQNWPAVVVDNVAAPLNMPSTQVDYANVLTRVAQGYVFSDREDHPVFTPLENLPDWGLTSAGLGAGALSSTLEDMLTFLEASISPPQGALGAAMAETQQAYPGSEGLSMGFGWQLSNDYLDKNGGLSGYQTYMAFDPVAKIGVFLFGNTSSKSPNSDPGSALDNAGRNLLGALRNSSADPSKFPKPPHNPQCPSASGGA